MNIVVSVYDDNDELIEEFYALLPSPDDAEAALITVARMLVERHNSKLH